MLFGMLRFKEIYMMLQILLAWFQFKVAAFVAILTLFSSPAEVDEEG